MQELSFLSKIIQKQSLSTDKAGVLVTSVLPVFHSSCVSPIVLPYFRRQKPAFF